MARFVLALALSFATVSAAVADVCIQIDSGSYSGSQIVLKKAKLKPRTTGALQGYLAQFNSSTLAFDQFYPVDGQFVVASSGEGALGLGFHQVDVGPTGSGIGTT